MPTPDIVAAAVETEARAVALSVVYGNSGGVAREVEAVRTGLPAGVDLLVGGEGSQASQEIDGVKHLEDMASLRSYLAEPI